VESGALTRADVDDIAEHLDAISARVPLRSIKSKRDYKVATDALNTLLDAGGADETSSLAPLVALLGALIGDYEDAHASKNGVSPADVVRFLMEQHKLGQSDLPEIGSQGVVSEVLSGKRDLNVRQIKRLSERFGIGPQLFV
jgi:HTH-type transcriptional regulator / antitoxin HigA